MSEKRYDIYFAGECLPGHDPASVRTGLASLFKADENTLDKLFTGNAQRIKRDTDEGTAAKYQKAMAGIGAKAIVRTTQATSGGTTALSLASVGSDVLRDDERAPTPSSLISTDHLDLAEPGSRLTSEAPPVAAAAQAPDLDVAPVGTDIAAQKVVETYSPPNTEGLSLADEGTDLSDCAAPEVTPPAQSIEHLSLAASGSELLDDSERSTDDAVAPDTSHIRLTTDDNPFSS